MKKMLIKRRSIRKKALSHFVMRHFISNVLGLEFAEWELKMAMGFFKITQRSRKRKPTTGKPPMCLHLCICFRVRKKSSPHKWDGVLGTTNWLITNNWMNTFKVFASLNNKYGQVFEGFVQVSKDKDSIKLLVNI